MEILSSRRVSFLLLGIFTNLVTYIYMDPILAPFMQEQYGVETEFVGLVFLCIGVGYIAYCALLPCLSRFVPRRSLIHGSAFLYTFAIFFIGPSKLLGIP